MTTRSEHPAATHSFVDEHAIAPRRGAHILEIGALFVIAGGDAVAFQMIAARALRDSQLWVVWALIIALSLAATFSMHLVGTASRARKANTGLLGQGWTRPLVGLWFCLGLAAFWFRLKAARADHQTAPELTAGFGSAAPISAATDLPMAALLLLLYLLGGACAFALGHRMHNPARGAYLRAQRQLKRADKSHRRAVRRRDELLTGPTGPRRWNPLRGRASVAVLRVHEEEAKRNASAQVAAAEAQADQLRADLAARTRAAVAARTARHLQAAEDAVRRRDEAARHLITVRSAATRAPSASDLSLTHRIAEAQAEQLRQAFRHQLARHLGEPASTSGVFNQRQLPTDLDAK